MKNSPLENTDLEKSKGLLGPMLSDAETDELELASMSATRDEFRTFV